MNDRWLLRVLLITGAITVVLAATPYLMFDLDRFFVPKELLLHSFTLALVLLSLRQVKTLEFNRIDLLLVLYLLLSSVSALFTADHWLSTRAIAITLSGAGIFWVSRSLADAGARRMIVLAAAFAAVIGAATSLMQAYGFSSDFFSLNRAPGGTFGNRNFMAHLAAICMPALIFSAVTARRTWLAVLCAAGLAVIADALILSRSRAAYLGLAAGAGILTFGFWRARSLCGDPKTMLRLKYLVLAAAAGILAALLLPNTLEWRSQSPYLDTVSGIVNYRKGSGHGRLIQYGRTLRITASHPLLGAGPGNWAVVYPKFAPPYDASLNHDGVRTKNPWPSSDWMAIISERGTLALAAILLVLFGLFMGALRRTGQCTDTDGYTEGLTLAATIAVTVVVACFDVVLLLPATGFIVWMLLGAFAAASRVMRTVSLSQRGHKILVFAVAIVGVLAVLKSSGQIIAMALFSKAHSSAQLRTAAWFDPGNIKIRSHL